MPRFFRHCYSRNFMNPFGLVPGLVLVLIMIHNPLGCRDAGAGILPGRTGLGLESGLIKLQDGSWDYNNMDRMVGFFLEREMSHGWQLQFALRNGYVRSDVTAPGQEAGWTTHSEPPFATLITQPMIGADYLFASSARLSPLLGAGLGLTSWKVVEQPEEDPGLFATGDAISGYDIHGNPQTLEGTDLTFELRIGARLNLTPRLKLSARAVYQVMQGNDRDDVGFSSIWGPDHVDANRSAISGFVGLTWWLGQHDADGDGVPDDKDLCPNQAEDRDGFNDLDGCPDLDNDRDGIPDSQDLCPNLAEDPDGFEDQDGCPDLDNDGDGVPDAYDKCPMTPQGTPVDQNGCPLDTDRR